MERRVTICLISAALVAGIVIIVAIAPVRIESERYLVKDHAPLLDAIRAGASLDELGAILDANPKSVDVRNISGTTALHYAVIRGDPEIVQSLIFHGASIDAQIKSGWGFAGYTPLHFASLYDRPKITSILLKHGAAPDITAENGETAAGVAAERGLDHIVTILESEMSSEIE